MVELVELRYDEKKKELVISGIGRDDAERVGSDLSERYGASGDSVPTGVTGTYDPETGQLLIFSPGSDSTSDEVLTNLNQYFPGVGVRASRGDRLAHSQFYMHLDPNVYSEKKVEEFLGNYGYNVRLPGEPLQEQEVLEVEGLNVGPPVRLEEIVGKGNMVK